MRHIVLLLVIARVVSAQFERSTVELTFNGTAGAYTAKGSGITASPESQSYCFTTAGAEFFIAQGIAIGPQYGLLAVEEQPPAHSLVCNIIVSARMGESPVAVFARSGYGKGNAVSVPLSGGVIPVRVSEQWNVGVWTVGGGVKILVTESALVKVEMNYRNESYSDEHALVYLGPPTYHYQYRSVDYEYRIIGLLFGCSVLL